MCGWREILPVLAEAAVRKQVAFSSVMSSGSCPFLSSIHLGRSEPRAQTAVPLLLQVGYAGWDRNIIPPPWLSSAIPVASGCETATCHFCFTDVG